MPSQGIILGPFSGGANTSSDPSAIDDIELAECINLELDLNDSLVARPPFVASEGPDDDSVKAIGNAVFGSDSYIIFANSNGIWAHKLSDLSWVSITTDDLEATSCLQYDDKIWIPAGPGSSEDGISWSPGGGIATHATMPNGGGCVIYKERMWIAPGYDSSSNSSRLYFSDIADPGVWTISTDFYDVGFGDGQKLIDLAVFNNNLVIFKEESSYTLAYDTEPADAILIKINNTIGAARQYCVVPYERSIFVLHNDKLYEIVNFNFAQINKKFKFVSTQTDSGDFINDIFISLLGKRIVVRYFEKMYVYDLDKSTWSEWLSADESLNSIGPIFEHPNIRAALPIDVYRGGCNIDGMPHIVSINVTHDFSTVETNVDGDALSIDCLASTKNYDFGVGYVYKKMNFWGADVITSREIIGTAIPIVFGDVVTWESLESHSWDSLGSWASPLLIDASVDTNITATTGTLRRFLKFQKSLRFRQIKFSIRMVTDGSLVDGPCRLYTMTVFASSKQHVSKSVS